MKNIFQKNQAFASLMAIIVISSVTLILALMASLGALSQLQGSLFKSQSNQAFQWAESCLEQAYFNLKQNTSYTGETLNFEEGYCTVAVSGSDPNFTINAQATVEGFTRSLEAKVILTSNTSQNAKGIDVDQWQEF